MAIKLRRLSNALGVEICHADIAKPMSEGTSGDIHRAFLDSPIAQPVVRVHPETGRKALYLGEKVKCHDGMTKEESRPLIGYLNKHATRPEFVYRHQWRENDIAVWNNCCTMHQALADFDETSSYGCSARARIKKPRRSGTHARQSSVSRRRRKPRTPVTFYSPAAH